eukprot:scaffold37153_cov42-Tisochrysis_lutea.AAC.3
MDVGVYPLPTKFSFLHRCITGLMPHSYIHHGCKEACILACKMKDKCGCRATLVIMPADLSVQLGRRWALLRKLRGLAAPSAAAAMALALYIILHSATYSMVADAQQPRRVSLQHLLCSSDGTCSQKQPELLKPTSAG